MYPELCMNMKCQLDVFSHRPKLYPHDDPPILLWKVTVNSRRVIALYNISSSNIENYYCVCWFIDATPMHIYGYGERSDHCPEGAVAEGHYDSLILLRGHKLLLMYEETICYFVRGKQHHQDENTIKWPEKVWWWCENTTYDDQKYVKVCTFVMWVEKVC